MCTAVTFTACSHYFGRTLDYERVYAEQVVITPRQFPLPYRGLPTDNHHYAFIGMATVMDHYPLYYDAVNEWGLGMAGLNFVGNAEYAHPQEGAVNVAHFELIPYILGRCRNVAQARSALAGILVTDTAFSPSLPPATLHWMVADETECITVEITAAGMQIYDNPIGVLTNNPPFPYQLWNLTNYRHIRTDDGPNTLTPTAPLPPYSRGMGGMGLPGDFSSASRFVRAAFVRAHALPPHDEETAVSQFFHILGSVRQPEGCVQVGDRYERTQYACCCNTRQGIYYYHTYHNSHISAVRLRSSNMDATVLTTFPLRTQPDILYENK